MTAPAPGFDLDAYLARIGYHGPRAPTLATLHAVTRRHTTVIPFENLDVLLGRPIRLDPAALTAKLVHARRGGYCFEQNGLLLLALAALGFAVTPLSARVRLERPRDFTPPRTHLFLRVDLADGAWFTDAGVGACSLTAALRAGDSAEQSTPHEARRLVHEDGRWLHQARLGDIWTDVYEFTGEAMPLIDREVANHWTSTSPDSKFRQQLMVARAGPEGERWALRDRTLIHRRGAEVLAQHDLATREELLEVLATRFGLELPAGTRLDPPGAPWPT